MRVQVHDIALNVERAGEGSPLLLLHGFMGSTVSWDSLLPCLSRRQIIAVDLIGHGRSDAPADPERYRMERCIEDLLALLDVLGVECADVAGYSMGGRVALHLAAAAPHRVGTLILESASPGLAGAAEREARIDADEEFARYIEREGLEAFVDRWERVPLFASQLALAEPLQAEHRAQRLRNNPLGLASSLRGMGAGRQEPLWRQLAELEMPTLLIVGEHDSKYRAIARSMAAMPNARVTVVPGAGHTVHLEQPDVFGAAVLAQLNLGVPAGPVELGRQ